jgi:hypothetical protein
MYFIFNVKDECYMELCSFEEGMIWKIG